MSSESEKSLKKVGFDSNASGGNNTADNKDGGDSSSSGYEVKVAVPKKSYGTNKKNSSQYTGLSFIPLNLWQQLKNPVFQFYLLIMILEVVPGVSVTDQLPRTLYPYMVVMVIQMIVDYLVTFKVNNLDNIQNDKKVTILRFFEKKLFLRRDVDVRLKCSKMASFWRKKHRICSRAKSSKSSRARRSRRTVS